MRVAATVAIIGILLGAGGARDAAHAGSTAVSGGEASAAETDARADWVVRIEAARQRYAAFVARAESEFRARRPARIAAAVSLEPLAAVLDDPTLRYNDLVVTADGVFAFRGVEAFRHSETDFERLPDARIRALSLRTYGETN